jgi:hypothetical protein
LLLVLLVLRGYGTLFSSYMMYADTILTIMKKHKSNIYLIWLLFICVLIISFVAWLEGVGWKLNRITSYSLFPLFGLWAFSTMWTHYIAGAYRRLTAQSISLMSSYYKFTGWFAFVCLLLHPTVLIVKLWVDGYGLPPSSYLQYAGAANTLAVGLGSLGLMIFLAYESKRLFSNRTWWKYVGHAQLVGMYAILVHGFSLGGEMSILWFRYVWIILGVTLTVAVSVNTWFDYFSNDAKLKDK